MNFTVYLSDIYIEQYPLISNARLNVSITDAIDKPPHKGYSQTCDSDIDFYGEKSISFETMWGEYNTSSSIVFRVTSANKWKPLTPDQMQEICEEYEDEIVKMLWEFIEEINEDYQID